MGAIIPHGTVLALVHSHAVSMAVSAALEQPDMARLHLVSSDDGRIPQISRPPSAVIVEMEESETEASIMDRLSMLSECCDDRTIVFVIGHSNDVRLFHRLRAVGVTDYYVAPVSVADVSMMLAGQMAQPPSAHPEGKLVAVVGARGGSGATTIAVNVAWQLAHDCAEQTCLIDLDIPFGGVATELDLHPDPTVSAALYHPELITDVGGLEPLVMKKGALGVISAAPDLSSRIRLTGEGLDQFVRLVRSQYRYTVLDLPLRWSLAVEGVLGAADTVILVTTADLAGIPPAQALMRHLVQVGVDPLVVINHVTPQAAHDWPIDGLKKALSVPSIHVVSSSGDFREGTGQGLPVSASAPTSAAARAMSGIVADLRGEAPALHMPAASGAIRGHFPVASGAIRGVSGLLRKIWRKS